MSEDKGNTPIRNQETAKEAKELKQFREKELFDAYEVIKDTVAVIKILRKVPFLTEGKVEIKEMIIGHGSGFIYILNGIPLVFTAYHVISDLKKDDSIEIMLKQKDGRVVSERNIQVFFNDPDHDIAALLLSLDGNNLSSVSFSKPVFTPTTLLKIGVRITYCGFPYISRKGEFIPIFQQGIIAGIDTGRFTDDKVAYIIDGMVNPGNSGGPAFVGTSKDAIGIISAYIKPMLPGPRLAIIDDGETIDLMSRSAGLGIVVPINYAVEKLRYEINRLIEEKRKEVATQNIKSDSSGIDANLAKAVIARTVKE